MKLYYFQADGGNFGDDLNAWLWPRLFPGLIDEDPAALFVGIGTILTPKIPEDPKKIVFGTGVRWPDHLPKIDDRWDIRFVRGPLSAKALGLDDSKAITDSAACLALLDLPAPAKTHAISYMPHMRTSRLEDWKSLCRRAGLNYIDPTAGVEHVLNEVRASELLIAEAMHGAIAADSFRIPWIPVQVGSSKNDGGAHVFKWNDWCQSIGIPYKPTTFSSIRLYSNDHKVMRAAKSMIKNTVALNQIRKVIKFGERHLSSDDTFQRNTYRLSEHVQHLQTHVY